MGDRRSGSPKLVLSCLTVLCLSFVSSVPGSTKSRPNQLDKFSEFDSNITRAVASKLKGNVLLSPISLKLVLALLYEGSGGETRKELATALDIPNDNITNPKYSHIMKTLETKHDGYELDIGMKVFITKSAEPKVEFAQKIKSKYNATVTSIDFNNTREAVSQINEWGKAVTKGHIENLVSEDDTKDTTVLLLLNAIYFKASWKDQFPVKNTRKGLFSTSKGTQETVEYMTAYQNLDYVDSEKLNAAMVRLPYVEDKFAMYVILPNINTTIDSVLAGLNAEMTRELIDNMKMEPLQITLPKFSFQCGTSLAQSLQEIGVTKIFSTDADLRNIAAGSKDLVVSNVIQKASIDVNEVGTVATAVTAVQLENKFGTHSHPFNVSRAFLFFIMDEDYRTVIFEGRVENPAEGERAKATDMPPKPEEEKPSDSKNAVGKEQERPAISTSPGDKTQPPAAQPAQPPATQPAQPPATQPAQPPAMQPAQPPAMQPLSQFGNKLT